MPGKTKTSGEFFEGLHQSNVFDDRCNTLDRLIKAHGFGQWAMMIQIDPYSDTPDAADNFHFIDHRERSWGEEYDAENLAAVDPTWRADPQNLLPRFWDDIPKTAPQQRFMQRAICDGNQTNGISFIAPAPGGGGCGFSVSERDKRATGGTALEILGAVQVFRIFVQAEFSFQAATKHKMSVSDLLVLQLVNEGFGRAAIADTTGRTVAGINSRMYELRQQFGKEKDLGLLRHLTRIGILSP